MMHTELPLPAFYDPTTKTIYVSNDATAYEHLYRFALRRALATALLDQHFDWSTRLTTATPAAALGLRATIDGDALNVANTLAGSDAPDQLAPELLAFVQAHGGAGVCDDFGLAYAYASARTLRIADGPDEVHRNQIGKQSGDWLIDRLA